MKLIRFKEINSTNTYLKENYNSLDNLTVVVANHQTMGKGRLGRTWIDNDDLLFSILIKDGIEKATDYSLLIASTIIKVLDKYNPTVKWPNDIMIGDKKICGILLEAVTKEKIKCVVIGIGINVNTTSFPDDLRVKASSLKLISNESINKEELLTTIINKFNEEYNKYLNKESDYILNISNHFYLNNKKVSFYYQGKDCEGIVLGISNNGELIVDYNSQELYLKSGEVTLEETYKK